MKLLKNILTVFLVFLGCVGILLGIALACHFTTDEIAASVQDHYPHCLVKTIESTEQYANVEVYCPARKPFIVMVDMEDYNGGM